MNLEEAKQALKDGFKLTHPSFREFEFIEFKKKNFLKKIQDTSGVRYTWDFFWSAKPELIWQDNWEIYNISANNNETLHAQLRNKLSPIYSLASLCLELESNPNKIDFLIPLIIETAKNTFSYKSIIDDLLILMETETNDLQDEIKSERYKIQRIFDLSKNQILYLKDKINTLEKIAEVVEIKLFEK